MNSIDHITIKIFVIANNGIALQVLNLRRFNWGQTDIFCINGLLQVVLAQFNSSLLPKYVRPSSPLTLTWGLSGRSDTTCKFLIGWHTMWPNAGLLLVHWLSLWDLNGPPSLSLHIFFPIDKVLSFSACSFRKSCKVINKRRVGPFLLVKVSALKTSSI